MQFLCPTFMNSEYLNFDRLPDRQDITKGSWHLLFFSFHVVSRLLGFGKDKPLEVCWVTEAWDVKVPKFMQAWSISVTGTKHT